MTLSKVPCYLIIDLWSNLTFIRCDDDYRVDKTQPYPQNNFFKNRFSKKPYFRLYSEKMRWCRGWLELNNTV